MWVQAADRNRGHGRRGFAGFASGAVLLGLGHRDGLSDASRRDRRRRAPVVARPRPIGVYRLWRDLGYAVGALLAGFTAERVRLSAAMWLIAALTFASGIVDRGSYDGDGRGQKRGRAGTALCLGTSDVQRAGHVTEPSIYLDYNATTPVLGEVVDAMLPYLREHFGNPSSAHALGRRAKEALEMARADVASLLECDASEIVFTSGGTEASNLAIRGIADARSDRRHVVTSVIEHPATEKPCAWLEEQGWRVTRAGVDAGGRVLIEEVRAAAGADTALVTIMHANNETGVVQPITEIADAAHAVELSSTVTLLSRRADPPCASTSSTLTCSPWPATRSMPRRAWGRSSCATALHWFHSRAGRGTSEAVASRHGERGRNSGSRRGLSPGEARPGDRGRARWATAGPPLGASRRRRAGPPAQRVRATAPPEHAQC